MARRLRMESGQGMIEMALILPALLILTAGLVDTGRAFYQYNAVSAAARYGARWGSVVGGTCTAQLGVGASIADWCKQVGATTTSFWQQQGNFPLQGNARCSTDLPSSNFWTVSNFQAATTTTVVGAIKQRFDTTASSSHLVKGNLVNGFDLTQMRVCIDMPNSWAGTTLAPHQGDAIQVSVYYPFRPAGLLLGGQQINLNASSTYQLEG
jgi:Flp pilus assembly protein TadG